VHGVPATGLRFFNVYGPRQDPRSPYSGVISIFCDRLGAGPDITVFGDGGQTRDFVYVGDVVSGLLAAMAALAGEGVAAAGVFNVCTGRATSIAALAEAIGRLRGIEPRIAHAPARAGDVRASVGDPGRLARTLGVRAETPLAQGLARTMGLPGPAERAA
jgi:UDP-glucose 4-epimerase